jgi:hypothetical protein
MVFVLFCYLFVLDVEGICLCLLLVEEVLLFSERDISGSRLLRLLFLRLLLQNCTDELV